MFHHSSSCLEAMRNPSTPGWMTVDRNYPILLISNPGIKPGIAQVYHDIDQDKNDAVKKNQVLHNDDVTLNHGRDQGPSQSWHAKRLFYRHRPPQHESHQNA